MKDEDWFLAGVFFAGALVLSVLISIRVLHKEK